MLIAMAGLPGTGKSTLARRLAEVCHAVILNKDTLRAALFPAPLIEYSIRQDDFCMSLLFQTARYMLQRNPSQTIIIDGRTFSRAYQIAAVEQLAGELDTPLKIIECVCSDETAYRRLERKETAKALHPATNRDYQLYLSLKAQFEPIQQPKLVVNTDGSLTRCLSLCLAYVGDKEVKLS